NIGRQQVAAGGDRLPELNENRSELLQRKPDADRQPRRAARLAGAKVEDVAERPKQGRGKNEVVHAIAHQDTLDAEHPPPCTFSAHASRGQRGLSRLVPVSCSRRFRRASRRATSSRTLSTSARNLSTS